MALCFVALASSPGFVASCVSSFLTASAHGVGEVTCIDTGTPNLVEGGDFVVGWVARWSCRVHSWLGASYILYVWGM
ncbi:hypothetical protein R3P38DRAFT_3044359 [Favolaschia claudopus]|uniref:Secreted protein n=1 Tax=Favolaschia claudopus TaxID=2862362 RepID=A0AAW0A7D4_9AGAR